MLVNISRHVLVPEHKPLTDDEKKSLLDRYTVKETKVSISIQICIPLKSFAFGEDLTLLLICDIILYS